MAKIVPGILTDSEQDYRSRLLKAEYASDFVQIDVIDGKFANNHTVGVDIIKKYSSSSQLEIQLMVVDPDSYIDKLAPLEYVSRIIFPFEIDVDINSIIYKIKSHKKQAGLSLNPTTPIVSAIQFFDDIDLLLLMTGKPGFSGQKLGSATFTRIMQAKAISPHLAIEIDIGVNFDNARKLARTGADFLVAGSALYNSDDFKIAFDKLTKLADIAS